MIGSNHGGGAKRHRVDEQGDRCEAVGADAVDRISALPDELRQQILTHLLLKDAIRTGAVARGWRDLLREHRASLKVHLHPRDDPRRKLDALPRRRLDRFSLVIETSKLKASELQRFTEFAAECGVEDLHVETLNRKKAAKLNFHLPLCSPILARLSLHHISISMKHYKAAQPFRALEVICLHSVSISPEYFRKMMALCPHLRTFKLSRCNCGFLFDDGHRCLVPLVIPSNLKRVIITQCKGFANLNLVHVPSLRSFCYEGDFLDASDASFSVPPLPRDVASFSLPRDAALADLYIRYYSVSEQFDTNKLNKSLPMDLLSRLNALTICYNALKVVSSLTDLNLHSLRKLHLLMLKMEAVNLADLYLFLKICQCPNLQKLFLLLPGSSYKPTEGSIDEVREEQPVDGLDNLLMVVVKNFFWRRAEVQLVNFLLRKASSLRKLLIVSPNVAPPDLSDQADLFLLKEALANDKIMLVENRCKRQTNNVESE